MVARREFGSVEGHVIDLGTGHQNPSVRMKARLAGREVVCRVSRRDRDEIVARLAMPDAWTGSRLRVRGRLVRGESGAVVGVEDGVVRFIDPKPVDLDALHDPDFTGGMPTHVYVNRLRENDFD